MIKPEQIELPAVVIDSRMTAAFAADMVLDAFGDDFAEELAIKILNLHFCRKQMSCAFQIRGDVLRK